MEPGEQAAELSLSPCFPRHNTYEILSSWLHGLPQLLMSHGVSWAAFLSSHSSPVASQELPLLRRAMPMSLQVRSENSRVQSLFWTFVQFLTSVQCTSPFLSKWRCRAVISTQDTFPSCLAFGGTDQAHFVQLFYFPPCHKACGILIPWPGIEPTARVLEAQSLKHRITKEVPGPLSWPYRAETWTDLVHVYSNSFQSCPTLLPTHGL